jgi:hypothetical protein
MYCVFAWLTQTDLEFRPIQCADLRRRLTRRGYARYPLRLRRKEGLENRLLACL